MRQQIERPLGPPQAEQKTYYASAFAKNTHVLKRSEQTIPAQMCTTESSQLVQLRDRR